jgi:hypothetical protein
VNTKGNSIKHFALALVILIAFTPTLVNHVTAASSDLNLPTAPVMIEVFNGTIDYFITQLSDIPTGYDVANGTYPGWCVDTRTEMQRSPATHEASLYSSVNAPGNLSSERWDMVNYILNHKQGNVMDTQQALWYFVHFEGNYTPSSPTAQLIIDDAIAHGTGFVPAYGQKMAVICYPSILFPSQPAFQISIIEIANPIVPEFQSALILPLLMLPSLIVVLAYVRKHRIHNSAP